MTLSDGRVDSSILLPRAGPCLERMLPRCQEDLKGVQAVAKAKEAFSRHEFGCPTGGLGMHCRRPAGRVGTRDALRASSSAADPGRWLTRTTPPPPGVLVVTEMVAAHGAPLGTCRSVEGAEEIPSRLRYPQLTRKPPPAGNLSHEPKGFAWRKRASVRPTEVNNVASIDFLPRPLPQAVGPRSDCSWRRFPAPAGSSPPARRRRRRAAPRGRTRRRPTG
jgi:hypothetical protein